jgi:hypothetical protein
MRGLAAESDRQRDAWQELARERQAFAVAVAEREERLASLRVRQIDRVRRAIDGEDWTAGLLVLLDLAEQADELSDEEAATAFRRGMEELASAMRQESDDGGS